ncbi:LAME_0F19020g1_1 [Lachancea meyersii CBS 8951]|uniref:LAME_0F19020g1_1 n=1 Tax=Lachancea meyersii CBS 8951 TaxID=1266667 RepID=A0A1G4K155_9SACH|nr:LAME_0F19020g1_1 [Lachancea meyersii CBS 8951]
MTTGDKDPAVKLANDFKKRGSFDEEKSRILSGPVDCAEQTTLEEYVRNRAASLANDMVKEDESLIFKNRGSTSALIEGQLVKNGFEKLNTDNLQIDAYLRKILEDPAFKDSLKARLRANMEKSSDENGDVPM